MNRFLTRAGVLLTVTAGLAGCHTPSSTPTAEVTAIEATDSIPTAVKEFVKAVATNDSATFASLVGYPLERPYPLADIVDSSQMAAYYRVLVDDSLRQVVTTAGPDDWHEVGWRGWMLKDGAYVWIYDNVYSVNYLSSHERREMARLVADEIASLPDTLGHGITPMGCFVGADNAVYRLDKMPGDNNFRLAVYKDPDALDANPDMTLTGSVEIQGTVGSPLYTFSQGDTTISLEPFSSDDSGPELQIERKGKTKTVNLKPSYWRLLIKNKKNDAEK